MIPPFEAHMNDRVLFHDDASHRQYHYTNNVDGEGSGAIQTRFFGVKPEAHTNPMEFTHHICAGSVLASFCLGPSPSRCSGYTAAPSPSSLSSSSRVMVARRPDHVQQENPSRLILWLIAS